MADPTGESQSVIELGAVRVAASTLGLEIVPLEVRRGVDVVPALEGAKGRADALYVCADALFTARRSAIITMALTARLPTSHPIREHVLVGGLVSYGPNIPNLFRRAGEYVDKILRGAKPAEMAVEQPTKFDLVINVTTAKALGIEVPPMLIARADEVIE
jgi:putative ABC transport system substrate-binding protein